MPPSKAKYAAGLSAGNLKRLFTLGFACGDVAMCRKAIAFALNKFAKEATGKCAPGDMLAECLLGAVKSERLHLQMTDTGFLTETSHV